VTAVSEVGAFLDWGLEKDLLVPFKEQRQKMEQGRWYVVYLNLDEKSYRLYASNKTDKFLSNDNLTIEEGDMVSLMALSRSEIGYNVIVNNKHKGLVFANEVFRTLNVGDRLTGYVKKIREDNKIDITLQPIGYEQFNDVNVNRLISLLETNNGVLLLSDKSSPDEIYAVAGMSKKAFKRAVGALYKAGRVVLEKEKTILKS